MTFDEGCEHARSIQDVLDFYVSIEADGSACYAKVRKALDLPQPTDDDTGCGAGHFGVPPSLAARLDRIDRTVATLRHHPHLRWADLAQHLGFTDQPHLAREVKRLTSLTPTELRASLAHPIASTWPNPDFDAE